MPSPRVFPIRTGLICLLTLSLLGCKRPPDAPAELDDLCSYMVSHYQDKDTDALVAGLANIEAWLAADSPEEDFQTNFEATLEGYSVNNLSQETVDGLDDLQRDLTGLVGAAVGYDSSESVQAITEVMVDADQMEVYADTYEEYTREFITDPTCFLDHECETIEMLNWGKSRYALGIGFESESSAHMRWVDTDNGMALVHLTWLTGPAEVSVDWLRVKEQYYLNAMLPDGDETVRIQATWVIAELGSGSVPEGFALNQVIKSMQDNGQAVDTYIQAH